MEQYRESLATGHVGDGCGVRRPANRGRLEQRGRTSYLRRMTDKFAKFGWMARVTILHGPNDTQVQYYLVARETPAEVIATVRSSILGLRPEDDIVVGSILSPAEIEMHELQVDGVQRFLPRGEFIPQHTNIDR